MIKAIDKQSVLKICSGQVVLDQRSLIKELVENSLDAQATVIEVKLKEFGEDSIEVQDNGIGIDPEHYEKVVKRYYTSKIEKFDDIKGLVTFGFRGEALSSICALSNMTICTKLANQQIGQKLEFNKEGELTSQEPVARSQGTSILISNLFSTVPVRRKEYLRNMKREYAKSIALLQAYAIIACGVKFIVSNMVKNNKSIIAVTQGSQKLMDNIIQINGPKSQSQLVPIDVSEDQITISGYISSASTMCGRPITDRQFIYLNGRPIDFQKAIKIINECFKSLTSSLFAVYKPMIFLNISMPYSDYDINVTPDKRKVFMKDEDRIIEILLKIHASSYTTNERQFRESFYYCFFHCLAFDSLIDTKYVSEGLEKCWGASRYTFAFNSALQDEDQTQFVSQPKNANTQFELLKPENESLQKNSFSQFINTPQQIQLNNNNSIQKESSKTNVNQNSLNQNKSNEQQISQNVTEQQNKNINILDRNDNLQKGSNDRSMKANGLDNGEIRKNLEINKDHSYDLQYKQSDRYHQSAQEYTNENSSITNVNLAVDNNESSVQKPQLDKSKKQNPQANIIDLNQYAQKNNNFNDVIQNKAQRRNERKLEDTEPKNLFGFFGANIVKKQNDQNEQQHKKQKTNHKQQQQHTQNSNSTSTETQSDTESQKLEGQKISENRSNQVNSQHQYSKDIINSAQQQKKIQDLKVSSNSSKSQNSSQDLIIEQDILQAPNVGKDTLSIIPNQNQVLKKEAVLSVDKKQWLREIQQNRAAQQFEKISDQPEIETQKIGLKQQFELPKTQQERDQSKQQLLQRYELKDQQQYNDIDASLQAFESRNQDYQQQQELNQQIQENAAQHQQGEDVTMKFDFNKTRQTLSRYMQLEYFRRKAKTSQGQQTQLIESNQESGIYQLSSISNEANRREEGKESQRQSLNIRNMLGNLGMTQPKQANQDINQQTREQFQLQQEKIVNGKDIDYDNKYQGLETEDFSSDEDPDDYDYVPPMSIMQDYVSINNKSNQQDSNKSLQTNIRAARELEHIFDKSNFLNMQIIGQFNLGFIVARFFDNLFIIDQHASDEKKNFEKLMANVQIQKQKLIQPQYLNMSIADEDLIRENQSIFNLNGFEFSDNQQNGRLMLVSTPVCGGITLGQGEVQELAFNITKGNHFGLLNKIKQNREFGGETPNSQMIMRPSRIRQIMAMKACRSSIMIGQHLNKQQMQTIVHNLSSLKSPWNCPHGRPTMRHLFKLSYDSEKE